MNRAFCSGASPSTPSRSPRASPPFAVEYVDARWPQLGGNSRKNMAKTLTATTIALLRAKPTQFAPAAVRTALREWAFNTNRRPEAPRDVPAILRWVERNSLPVSSWEDPEKVDQVLLAIDTRLDGKQAAAWSRKRNRRILNVAMKYAVRRRILRASPLPKGKESTALTKTTNAVATLYCGPRPENAVAMRVEDVTLPVPGADDQWCEPLIHTATLEVGKQWTVTGEIHERRDLKGRAEGETRTVPGHPALTRVYDNRNTRLTKWLNDGIPPVQVAEWAGNSVAVLLATYARCVDGQLPDLKRRLEAAGGLPEEEPGAG